MPVSVWNGLSVFISGHTGFKGSWMCHLLAQLGARVTGYALPPPDGISLYKTACVADTTVDSTFGDIRDLDRLRLSIESACADVAFHFAAQPLVLESYVDPVNNFSTNVLGTVNFLEACRRSSSIKAIVIVTTDKCYENNEWEWGYRETDRLGGADPYSASKACAELVVNSYRKSFPSELAPIATARAGNVIGGGDFSPDRLVPDLIAGFSSNSPVEIRSPGSIRPWQHVLEALWGYIKLAEAILCKGSRYEGPWNFGPNTESFIPVSDIADRLVKLWGENARWVKSDHPRSKESRILRLDISKSLAHLDWAPLLHTKDALGWTVEWAKAHHMNADMRHHTRKQIERYLHKIVSKGKMGHEHQ